MSQRALHSWLIVALLFVSYLYVLPRWSDWNQNSRLNLVLAVVDDGTVSIDRYVANTGDYALYNGRTYTDKPPGLSFLAIPFYLVLSPVLDHPAIATRAQSLGDGAAMSTTLNEEGSGLREDKVHYALVQYLMTVIVVALPAAILGALLFLAMRGSGLSPIPAALTTIAYGLGTAAAPYAGNFYSHQLVATLLFGAFCVAWRPWEQAQNTATPPRAGWASGVLCGLLLGWAVISEYPSVLPGAVIGLYALWRQGWRWLPALLLGGIIPGALLITYDLVAFGTPWPIGYAHSALWQDQHQTGFMSLTYPRPESLWGLAFSPFRGLFIRAPWLLLALPGFMLWWRSGRLRAEWWVTMLAVITMYLFYGSSIMWWGGFAAGPRYIVPLIPFLALGAGWAVERAFARTTTRVATTGLIVLSVILTWTEATSGQLFPPDDNRNPWLAYVVPAWQQGDIARNLGMALGLQGALSLLPLVVFVSLGLILLFLSLRQTRPRWPALVPTGHRNRSAEG
ncbi:hypothetical protein [Candidatus Chloroploca sp. Khr17]|uniref:hypothetical protein n=1 Tax=Candidatus Chloroploca sp. Khr17 TaxID=2496869 RepID=UPI00101CC7F1|nr:hypothetical protein [Candidatus Chloroploca sp. Khr17]